MEFGVDMTKAYVLVTIEGDGTELLEELRKIDEITEARLAFGTYDIVIEVEGSDRVIGGAVMEKIRNIPKILTTVTILTTELYKKEV